jgi:hypothetical protein
MDLELPTKVAARMIVSILEAYGPLGWFRSAEKKVNLQQQQLELLKSLTEAGVDPQLFDRLLSTEVDRMLKVRFGIAFFVATVVFTLLSFAVIVFNSIYKWGISDIAITGLVIETPLQFIGLLYIIARNLFPQTPLQKSEAIKAVTRKTKPKTTAQGSSPE